MERGYLLSRLQFQQKRHEVVRLVQDTLLSQEENKQPNGFKTCQGIHAFAEILLAA